MLPVSRSAHDDPSVGAKANSSFPANEATSARARACDQVTQSDGIALLIRNKRCNVAEDFATVLVKDDNVGTRHAQPMDESVVAIGNLAEVCPQSGEVSP